MAPRRTAGRQARAHLRQRGHAPSDMNFGSKGSMRNLLNGSKAHIGRWKKGKRERCTSQPHKTPSQKNRPTCPLLQQFFHPPAAPGGLGSLVPDLVLGPRKALDIGELQQPGRRGTTRFFGTGSRVPMDWAASAIKPGRRSLHRTSSTAILRIPR